MPTIAASHQADEELALVGPVAPTLDPSRARHTRVDRRASRRLAALIGAVNRDCYHNSVRALLQDTADTDGAFYVEGLIVVEYGTGVFAEHGWLERPDGVVLDPTPVHCAEAAAPRVHFPIRRMRHREVLARVAVAGGLDNVTLPFLESPLGVGRTLPAWLRAQLAAWRHFSALHLARHGCPFFSPEQAEELVAALVSTHAAAVAAA